MGLPFRILVLCCTLVAAACPAATQPSAPDGGAPASDAGPDAGPDGGSGGGSGGAADAGHGDGGYTGCVPECPGGATRCADAHSTSACDTGADGCGRWAAAVACDGGKACSAGACVAACTAADTRCLDATVLQTCTDGQRTTQNCAAGCDSGAAACRVCTPGAWRCSDRGGGSWGLETCPSGTAWVLRAGCAQCGCAAAAGGVTMTCAGRPDTTTPCARCADDAKSCSP
jgi:hypothetical protein